MKREELFAWISNDSTRAIQFSKHFSRFAAEKHYGDLSRHYRGGPGSDYYLNVMTREEMEREFADCYVIDWKKRTLTPKRRS